MRERKRIKRELQEAKLPTINYATDQNGVRATLFNDVANRTNALDSEAYRALGEAIAFSLDPDERRIVNYAIEHGRINASDALRILSTTYWHTAKGKLKRLVDRGVLDFISKKHRDPNSHYVIRRPVAKEVVRRDSSGTRQRRGKRGSAAGREK